MDVVMENDFSVKVEMSEDPLQDPKDHLLEVMDRVESHVEDLRKVSLWLEERKDALFTTLYTIRNSEHLRSLPDTDRDDIHQYIERVTARCMTVDIEVRTVRNKQQEEALFQVNKLIDSLVISFKSDPQDTMTKCQSFYAACQDEPDVPVDKFFETSLLGCALDDQKRIKKRLCGLLDYLKQDRLTIVSGDVDSLVPKENTNKIEKLTSGLHKTTLGKINCVGITSRRQCSENSESVPTKRPKVAKK